MTSTALVLGAGGLTGGAFHAGVLLGLLEAGWDAATADLIVGTSAGASTGASLRAGLPVADIHAVQVGDEPSAATATLREGLPPALDFADHLPPAGRRPLSPALASRALLRRGRPRYGLAVAGGFPRGRMDTQRIASRIDHLYGGGQWPDEPFWVCSLRIRDGRRRVFGRDPSDATVGQAVAASSAVPGLLAPMPVDGDEHVDGAVHSPTNVDLVAGLAYERVVVSAPMAGTTDLRQPARAYHTRLLRSEVAAVRRRGAEVVVIQPDPAVLLAMGDDAMRPGNEREVAEAARQLGRTAL